MVTIASTGERLLLTVPEVGDMLGIGKSKAYAMVRNGEMPGVVRLGPQTVRIHRDKLIAWLHEQAHGVPAS